jgi:hypothetical protein
MYHVDRRVRGRELWALGAAHHEVIGTGHRIE